MTAWAAGTQHFKDPKGTTTRERRKTARKRKDHERDEKRKVRKREGHRCRFPLCGCRRQNYALHVSHLQHKGIGGNPDGDRSDARVMVQVCAPRHREHRYAIDRGTIRWRPLVPALGANGPIVWEIDVDCDGLDWLHQLPPAGERGWGELARESSANTIEPLSVEQRTVLTEMALMKL